MNKLMKTLSRRYHWTLSFARSTASPMFLLLTLGHCATQNQHAVASDSQLEGFRQFDSWIGSWDVNLRGAAIDRAGNDSVIAKARVLAVLDGKAILELWDSPTDNRFSLLHHDPDAGKWVLFVARPDAGETSIRSLEGEFRHGRGEFFAEDDGVLSRFTLCDITPTSLRWDDARSDDGGKTWALERIMEFSRTAAEADWLAGTGDTRVDHLGAEFDLIASGAGQWKGEVAFGDDGATGKAAVTAQAHRILGGRATIQLLEYQQDGHTSRVLSVLTYDPVRKRFEELRLDNRAGSSACVLHGKLVHGALEMRSDPWESLSESASSSLTTQWQFPSSDDGRLRIRVRESTGGVVTHRDILLERTEAGPEKTSTAKPKDGLFLADVVNDTCPRSGKPVVASSLATYRGYTVGFCNQHCRDDFAQNVADRPHDREFFDKVISERGGN